MRIIYLGTPDFAVAPLRALVEGGYNVVAVITMPDKPVGRHQNQLQASPVKQYAQTCGLPILQPANLKDPDFIQELRSYQADLQIVVAFRMLPEAVWSMPRLGTFNLHASLLPQYRGAAPINWAIINGDTETGITTFFLKHAIDTGDIIQQVRVPINDDDNAETIHDRLMNLGAQLVVETVDRLKEGNLTATPQAEMTDTELRPAPKIFKETCRIPWHKGVKSCYDFIRGLSPYPAAWTEIILPCGERLQIKVYGSRKEFCTPTEAPGTLFSEGSTLRVTLPDGYLTLTEVQLAGKKRMSAADFLRGYRIAEGTMVAIDNG